MPMMPARMNPRRRSVHRAPVVVELALLVRPISRNVIAIVKITPPRMSKLRVALGVLTVGSRRWMTISDDDPDRDVDVEDPVPADLFGQEATDQRADDEGDAEDGAEEALVLASLLRREQVADDRERDREQGDPAPMPWMPRKRMSIPMFWLRPDRAEPTRKITMPIMKIGLRP